MRTHRALPALAVLLAVGAAAVGCVAEQPAASEPTPTASAPSPTRTTTPTVSSTPTPTPTTPSGPDVSTDNVIDVAWAPMAPEDREAAEQALLDQGWERVDVDGVEYLSVPADPTTSDADWVNSFLFTGSDVRWAQYQDEHDLIRSVAG
ncbi:hypothetical protein ABC304_12045 [Microbacterium sp. 1P10UB]|uniref:hypothetical protein n=1 Tax=unclassified Microbacterium TaxID=2609290 RepID=UPI0039A0F0D2